jgi:DNA-binding transcriptional MerR regulator
MKLFSIGRVAELLGVSTSSLRLWEADGSIPKPSRTITEHRFYSESDVAKIREVLQQKHPVK